MSKKKRTKRSKSKYPGLDPEVNTKRRQDYMDMRYYVKDLPEFAKEWLNDFCTVYYGESKKLKYGNTEVLESRLTKDEYEGLKKQLSRLRARRRKIFQKSADSTSEEDRQECYMLNQQIEELDEFLSKMVPMRKSHQDNYDRREDFLNISKASNTYDLVSWEELKDKELNEIQEEGIFSPFKWEDEE